MNRCRLLAALLALLGTLPGPAAAVDELEIGRRIYLEGQLPSGKPLTGKRFDGITVTGAQAACVTCHRRSGLGAVEGDVLVPPITGKFLFAGEEPQVATMDQRRRKSFNQVHEPYSEASFANAVRHGIEVGGRSMKVVMPHYALSDGELRALSLYLQQLSAQWSPGVSEETIRLATVIAPGVDAARRQALLDTLRSAIAQKNGSTAPGRRHMVSPAELMMRSERNWQLDVWELQGEPTTWRAQLAEFYRRQPVFALLSGLSESTWQPVQDFCAREQVPCWFPSVDLPVEDENFSALYFSRGVLLESDVLAGKLLADGDHAPQRLIQIYRDNLVGNSAARGLASKFANSKIAVESRVLPGTPATDASDALRQALAGTQPGDSVMFWLASTDLRGLDKLAPGDGVRFYFSGTLGKIQAATFSAPWKAAARLLYPYELPARRAANLAYFHAWLKLRRLPLVDEVLQSEAYFAVSFLSETLAEMLQNVQRDYLIERAEEMLGKREASKAEEEARTRQYLGRPGDLTRKYGTARRQAATENLVLAGAPATPAMPPEETRRESTTGYPHLSLAQDQRFASKGAYIVRFDPADPANLLADGEWTIP
jgi:hypothetical protein